MLLHHKFLFRDVAWVLCCARIAVVHRFLARSTGRAVVDVTAHGDLHRLVAKLLINCRVKLREVTRRRF